MYRYKHNPLARPSRISWSNSELKNWNSKRDVFDTRRNHPDRGIFVTIILVFLCCISCACVCTCWSVRACMCVPHICILYIYIRIYIYMYSFIHTSSIYSLFCFSNSFSFFLISLFHSSFIFFYDLWIHLQLNSSRQWLDRIAFDENILFLFFLLIEIRTIFSTRYRSASFFYLSDFSFFFFFFDPLSRYFFLSRDVRRTIK